MSSEVIRCHDVSHRYGKTIALKSLNLSMQAGQVTALLGPNGAGKSTLIHLLLGLLPVQSGQIEVMGRAPKEAAKSGQWGAMLQTSGVQDTLTVTELLYLFSSLYAQPAAIDDLIDEAGLSGLEQTRYARLSGGQKQRMLFALSLVGQPQLLILDEPTTGLDPAARRGLWRAIERRRADGVTVLLCTHYLDEAEHLADQVVVLNHGEVLATDTADAIKARVPNAQILARSTLDDNALNDLPAVQSVDHREDRVAVLSADAPSTLRAWLSADQQLSDLDVRGADLETAFLSLTNESQPELFS